MQRSHLIYLHSLIGQPVLKVLRFAAFVRLSAVDFDAVFRFARGVADIAPVRPAGVVVAVHLPEFVDDFRVDM